MEQAVSTSVTRRSMVTALALAAAPVAVSVGADNAYAQAKQFTPEKSLYERLGGVFAIAAVVDHFRDAVGLEGLRGGAADHWLLG
jgi:hemoglobin